MPALVEEVAVVNDVTEVGHNGVVVDDVHTEVVVLHLHCLKQVWARLPQVWPKQKPM